MSKVVDGVGISFRKWILFSSSVESLSCEIQSDISRRPLQNIVGLLVRLSCVESAA